MSDLAALYLTLVDSFVVVFGLFAEAFRYRPWLLPLIPVTILAIGLGLRLRRVAPPPPPPRDPATARRNASR